MTEIVLLILLLLGLGWLIVVGLILFLGMRLQKKLLSNQTQAIQQILSQVLPPILLELETKHRITQGELYQTLQQQSDRTQELVRNELAATREGTNRLAQQLTEQLGLGRASMGEQLGEVSRTLQESQEAFRLSVLTTITEKIVEQGRAEQTVLQETLRTITGQLTERAEGMTKAVDQRLEQISGKVTERLDEGFKHTNQTFTNVMTRLAVIDEAQKKIENLSTNVVSLQELLGDKRSRGAFGEVQLEALVRNLLPPGSYAFQHMLTPDNRDRVDCALFLPAPTGTVAVDAKFPLENYHRSYNAELNQLERELAQRELGRDLKKHIDAIANKYIVPGVTSDGAVLFLPAEAIFAEIHSNYPEIIDYAQNKRVWIVSPTTLMAVLNTARAVLRDVETRQQIHVIQSALTQLGKEFSRFDERMQKLATHIRQAQEDVQLVQTTSQKISSQFRKIEQADLDLLENQDSITAPKNLPQSDLPSEVGIETH